MTVLYQDTEGNEISKSKTLSGNIGDPYDVSTQEYKLAIQGYTFKETRGALTGNLSNDAQSVTYIYTKDPVRAKDLTVLYQDTEGNEISNSKIISGNVGDPYDVSTQEYKLAIQGYTFKETKGALTGSLSNDAQSVTYIYTKKINKQVSTNSSSNKQKKTIIINENTNNSSDYSDGLKNLPKTGESTNHIVSLVGILILFSVYTLWKIKPKSYKK